MSKRVRKDPSFDGPFAEMCRAFVSYKRSLGVQYNGQIQLLHSFDNFSKDFTVNDYEISMELAEAWSRRRHGECETHRSARILVMRHFAQYLTANGYRTYMQPFKFKSDHQHTPYIFTHEEMKRIFHALDHAEPSPKSVYRNKVYPMLYRILYACGLRIGEALGLKLRDIDVEKGLIHLTKTKNNIERLVPMSDSLSDYCRRFVEDIHSQSPADFPFICTMHGEHYCASAIQRHFRDLLWDAKIPYGGRLLGPRVHDLRHTFACHQLYRWASEGKDLMVMLPILSKYLGHSGVLSTQWYLRLTGEAYPDIMEKMTALSGCVFPEIGGVLLEETE